MALNWNWSDKCGTIVERFGEQEWTYFLYDGNALMIALAEWEEDGRSMWNMHSFWLDEKHADACLADDSDRIVKITLNPMELPRKKLTAIRRICERYNIPLELTD